MSSPDQEHKSDSTSLDTERARLRSAGYTDAEISQILIARASQQPAGTGQGALSNALSSIVAVGSQARALVPTFRNDVATVFDGGATASARAGATASLAVKAVVILVLGYAAWQEWRQHIISATEIAASQSEKARAEACSARIKAIIDTVPMNRVAEATEIVQRDCDPTYAQRTAACSAKFKALVDALPTLSPDDFKAKIDEYKNGCVITDADRELAQAKLAEIESEKKQRVAAVTAFLQDRFKAKTEFDAGHYDEAFKIEGANAAATEAFEIKTFGKAGDLTVESLGKLSWYALFTRQYADALDAAERSLKIKPNLAEEINHAHALMMLGRAAEAKALYRAHKGERLQGKTWEEVIVDDFDKLRKAGIKNSLMEEIEDALSSWPPESFRPWKPGLYDPGGVPCDKPSLRCHWLCMTGRCPPIYP
jgi:tetratricopeptide (TPR) repeat protein